MCLAEKKAVRKSKSHGILADPLVSLQHAIGQVHGSTPHEARIWGLIAGPRPHNTLSNGLVGCYGAKHYRYEKRKDVPQNKRRT